MGLRHCDQRRGNAYVTGDTNSAGWATPGAFDTSFNGGSNDAFVAKLNPSGASLVYATYLGGTGYEEAGISVDGSGNAYVVGSTSTAGWATAGAYDTTFNGNSDAFVAKVSPSGSSLLYATYLGGSGFENVGGIAVDGSGNAYITGRTNSDGWATGRAYDTTQNGDYDAFVGKLNASGSSLLYATYLGGSGQEFGRGIAIDGSSNAYATGFTLSSGLGDFGGV